MAQEMDNNKNSKIVRIYAKAVSTVERRTPTSTIAQMKAKQSNKIRELRQAILDAGYLTVEQQAKSLGLVTEHGLSRSEGKP